MKLESLTKLQETLMKFSGAQLSTFFVDSEMSLRFLNEYKDINCLLAALQESLTQQCVDDISFVRSVLIELLRYESAFKEAFLQSDMPDQLISLLTSSPLYAQRSVLNEMFFKLEVTEFAIKIKSKIAFFAEQDPLLLPKIIQLTVACNCLEDNDIVMLAAHANEFTRFALASNLNSIFYVVSKSNIQSLIDLLTVDSHQLVSAYARSLRVGEFGLELKESNQLGFDILNLYVDNYLSTGGHDNYTIDFLRWITPFIEYAWKLPLVPNNRSTCICCGFKSFVKSFGSFHQCDICGWIDDPIQGVFINTGRGANERSLFETQHRLLSSNSFAQLSEKAGLHNLDKQRVSKWRPIIESDIVLSTNKYLRFENFKERLEQEVYYWKKRH